MLVALIYFTLGTLLWLPCAHKLAGKRMTSALLCTATFISLWPLWIYKAVKDG